MSIHNVPAREITYKLAYHGPGMCGKTTNLRYIHNAMPGKQAGQFLVLDTAVERTLFYDFLPLVFSTEDGYRVRFHLYTVPGQSYYEASRKLVLKGVDGLVFVADSRADRRQDNLDSLAMLKQDLADIGLAYADVPLVMQWNKRDVEGAISREDLDRELNERKAPAFDAVARDGQGVFETLAAIAALATEGIS